MLQVCFAIKIFVAIAHFVLLTGFTGCEKLTHDPVSANSMVDFGLRLDNLRKDKNIPGMVAGLIKDGQVIWTKNYGYADLQKNIPVINSTIFHLASLTKTFASAIIIQLVNENKINLNDPVSKYGINLSERDTVRLIHLLTHTSEGTPGKNYNYNGDRYSLLSQVIQSATGQTFHKLTRDRITQSLGLHSTAPSDMRLANLDGFDTSQLKQNTAEGYASNGTQSVDYPKNFSTAAGLISNINDMLKYAGALEGNLILTDDMKAKVFTPMVSNDRKTLPYGLGWFVQQMGGINLNWHYGYWVGMSSLIIRVPEKKLTFILMANSDMLSAPYRLGDGDIWVSPYAKEFLKSFVLAGARL